MKPTVGRHGETEHADTSDRSSAPHGACSPPVLPGYLETLLDVAAWLPPVYRRYTRLVRDGFAFFFVGLPRRRRHEILAEQRALGEAPLPVRLIALMRHCPVLHKLGQVLAHEQHLDVGLRERLETLESLPPTLTRAALESPAWRALGRRRGLELGEPLAEASVAVVAPFRLAVRGAAPQEGVLKLLRPGVVERLREDLAHWPQLAAFLARRARELDLPPLDFHGTLETVRRLLCSEIRLEHEQHNLRRARRLYSRVPVIVIPRVLACSTPRATAMERIHGAKITTAPGAGHAQRHRLARLLLEELLVRPLLASAGTALVHGDPHPGNLFLTEDARLAVLDWSLAAEVGTGERRPLARIVLSALAQDAHGVARAAAELGHLNPDTPAVARVVASGLRRVRAGALPAFDWTLGLLDDLAREAGAHFSESFTVLRKAVHMLSGVARTLDPHAAVGDVITAAAMGQISGALLRGESSVVPLRADDWARLAASFSLAPARYWVETWNDLYPGLPAERRG